MDATQDILHGKWYELRGEVKLQWGKLTDEDLTRLNAKTEELVHILRQRYGYGEAQAAIEINNWLLSIDKKSPRLSPNTGLVSRRIELPAETNGSVRHRAILYQPFQTSATAAHVIQALTADVAIGLQTNRSAAARQPPSKTI